MMKKILTGLMVAIFVVAPSFASAQAPSSVQALLDQLKALQEKVATLKTTSTDVQSPKAGVAQSFKLLRGLRQGMSGEDVTALQTLLAADPTIYPTGKVTGFFGSLTAEAVKNFQKKNGIDAVGFVGPKTLQKLNDESDNLGLSVEGDATSTDPIDLGDGAGHGKRLCAMVPPGHMIASGWLRKNGGIAPIVPECQTLPAGIMMRLGSTTPISNTAPLSISNLRSSRVSSSTATISWTTKTPSSSLVWFSSTSPVTTASSTSVSSNALVTLHSLNLTGLATSTTYYYVAVSSNSSSTATSTERSFITNNN